MIKIFFYFLPFILLACNPGADYPKTDREILYVGTFSVRGSEGVYVYQFNRDQQTFEAVEQVSGPESPSYLDIAPDGKYLFTTNRGGIGADTTFGSVCSYQIDSLSGKLQLIDQSSSFGISPCHISIDENGQWLFLSHYAGGSLAVLPILPDGHLGPLFDTLSHHGHSIHPTRQEAPHVHSIQTIPGTDYFLTADLGTDKLYFYKKGEGKIQLAPIAPIEEEPGSGPRHFTLSKDRQFLYVSEELSSSVSVYHLDLQNNTTTFLQRLSTLPPEFESQNTVADIHISPDGKFLYASNRGHDSLAIFQIEQSSGKLQFLAHQKTGGKTPRNFLIDPRGTFVLVAHQDTDDVAFFTRNQNTGLLETTNTKLAIPSPVCLQWLVL